MKKGLEPRNESIGAASDKEVVDKQHKDESVAIFVHVAVECAAFEAKFLKNMVNIFVLDVRTLLEAVETFLELTDKLFLS